MVVNCAQPCVAFTSSRAQPCVAEESSRAQPYTHGYNHVSVLFCHFFHFPLAACLCFSAILTIFGRLHFHYRQPFQPLSAQSGCRGALSSSLQSFPLKIRVLGGAPDAARAWRGCLAISMAKVLCCGLDLSSRTGHHRRCACLGPRRATTGQGPCHG